MNAVTKRKIRRFVPLIWVIVAIVGFLVSETVGVIVVIVAGVLSAFTWTLLSGGNPLNGGASRKSRDRLRDL